MKNKSWVCFILALVSVVLLAGCAGEDSGGGGVVESVDKGQEEGLIGNDEENQEYNEEVFEDNKSKKETSDEMLESSEASDCVEIIAIDEEVLEEYRAFFQSFLKAYIEGDEETFKTYMSEELYNEYLMYPINPSTGELWSDEPWHDSSILLLSQIVDDRLMSWWIYNPHNPDWHYPGATFFTRLKTFYDIIYDEYDIGSKFLVNISCNENHEFSVNWFAIEQ